MHDALHATGPDVLCNTTASLPAPSPARSRPGAYDNHQKDAAVLLARADRWVLHGRACSAVHIHVDHKVEQLDKNTSHILYVSTGTSIR